MADLAKETWPCGHDRTPENTQSVGIGNGTRCRACRRVATREHARRARGYYERFAALLEQPSCDGCGSRMVQSHATIWECSAACPISTGEWPEYTKAAQSMMARAAISKATSRQTTDREDGK